MYLLQPLLGWTGEFVWSCGLDSSGDAKDDHLQVQNHHDCIRVARDVLVLRSGGYVHKSSFKASLLGVQSNLPLVSINNRFVSSKLNHKPLMYVFPVLDCEAWGTDALNFSWEGLDSFVFGPVALKR